MISGTAFYVAVNVLVAVAALAAIFLVPRQIPAGTARKLLVIALALLLLSGGIFAVSLRFFKLAEIAYTGQAFKVLEQGTFEFIYRFKDVALAGNIAELVAVALLASVGRTLLRAGGETGGDGIK
ncbi:MAG: hypothetical protein C4520_19480 [Candidatus Abyssobacteria bacterium SURF_5]|uniref:Uncharacterized protein n=1 Tax=Abyssobacteria bacterium (strain SURF_5) TaxID=2093360 RepID=A0A3A4NGT9_ABYX5|nr:MAG: hypothetical protein C4520_19480 [Candidatus Abyssubacteria bacterium SURF_5]